MKITTSLFAPILIGAILTLTGCASPVSHDAMVPHGITVAKHHAKSVAVVTGGGSETNPAWKSQVSDDALKQALVDAIKQTKTFSSVVEGKSGDYVLNVTIFNVTQPNMGFSFTVGMEMGWTLTRADTGAVAWQESIKSQHTTSTGEAFAGVTRLKMATEGAARNNVALGLQKLAALSL